MKIQYNLYLLLLGILLSNFAQPTKGKLEIYVNTCKSDQGQVLIALYDGPKDYMNIDQAVIKKVVKIKNGVAQLKLEDFAYGKYAIVCFHDENSNNKLDKNLVGIPKEGYGFSNDARGSFGPPSFKKANFEFNSAYDKVQIKLSYW